MNHRVLADYSRDVLGSSNVKVFVRARPPDPGRGCSDAGDATAGSTFEVDVGAKGSRPRRIVFRDPASRSYGDHAFTFDGVFWSDTEQEEMFEAVARTHVDQALRGLDTCCFAYGQTGSGKTYTMFGGEGSCRGLIPRTVEEVMAAVERRAAAPGGGTELAVAVSFVEIYCDQIRDLGRACAPRAGAADAAGKIAGPGLPKTSEIVARLELARRASFTSGFAAPRASFVPDVAEDYASMNCEIREDGGGNVFVKDLALIPVSTMSEIFHVIDTGLRLRATHDTKMNAVSSRSHTIFTIAIVQHGAGGRTATTGRIHLVDLAGSERLKKSESEGQRLREALHINTSLAALGKVVMALDPSVQQSHVPYRDSKLTRLLQNSLGGNSCTSLIATIHPARPFADECLSTLQFANRCRNVRNQPRVNYLAAGSSQDAGALVRRLQAEVEQLRHRLALAAAGSGLAGGNDRGPVGAGGRGAIGACARPGAASLPSMGPLLRAGNLRAVAVLRALGISAQVRTDGSIRTGDGRVVPAPTEADKKALRALAASTVAEDDSDDEATATSRWGSPTADGAPLGSLRAAAADALANAAPALRDLVAALERRRNTLRRRVDSREEALQREAEGARRARAALQEAASAARAERAKLRAELEATGRRLEELERGVAEASDSRLDTIARNSKRLLDEQRAELQTAHDALRAHGARRAEPRGGPRGGRVEQEETARLETIQKRLQEARRAEVGIIRDQYEHWLGERDAQLAAFAEAFNRYRETRRQRREKLEKEVLVLADALRATQKALRRCEDGEFTVRIDGAASTARPIVPPGARPPDPFAGSALLETRRLTERRAAQRSNHGSAPPRSDPAGAGGGVKWRRPSDAAAFSAALTARSPSAGTMGGGAGAALRAAQKGRRRRKLGAARGAVLE